MPGRPDGSRNHSYSVFEPQNRYLFSFIYLFFFCKTVFICVLIFYVMEHEHHLTKAAYPITHIMPYSVENKH